MVEITILSKINQLLTEFIVLQFILLVSSSLTLADPIVKAGLIDQKILLDGILDEALWQNSGQIDQLIQQDPTPGQSTQYHTQIKVLVDSDGITLGLICNDPDPNKIAIHTMQRDGNMGGDDSVSFIISPDNDGRRGYFFQINSAGARTDGLIAGAGDLSLDWDGVWDAATHITATGWTAEIHIPAHTLRFKWGQDSWGFNIQRYIPRDQLTLRWAGISLDAQFDDLQRAGSLIGVKGLRQGKGISVSPYILVSGSENYQTNSSDHGAELGGDFSWNFNGDLSAYMTLNPDFAETEVDTRQVNLTRFSLFFPEKRSFFLEGSEMFNFGSGLDEDFIPFFSRRIGLFDGEKIALPVGFKLLGRSGPWQIATLGVATKASNFSQQSNLFSGRVTYDINQNLTLGAITTHGDPQGKKNNTLAGMDILWRTSTFNGHKNFSVGAWSAASYGDLPKEKNTGWGFKVDYPNDLWDLSLTVKNFGKNLDPALGFLPRPGTRWYQAGIVYQPRPKSGSFSWVRQFFFEMFPRYIQDDQGRVESWRIFMAPFNARTQSGEHLEANIAPQFERLNEPFEITNGVIIPAGDYQYTRYRFEAQSSNHRPWRVGGGVWFGHFFSGSLTENNIFANYTTPQGHWRFEFQLEHDVGKLPKGNFTLDVAQAKVIYAVTPNMILSSNIQYDSETRNVGTNSRFRWTIQPGADLFIVWNHGWQKPFGDNNLFNLQKISDQILAKLRWTFRQ